MLCSQQSNFSETVQTSVEVAVKESSSMDVDPVPDMEGES